MRALALAVLLAACSGSHPAALREVSSAECVACHRADYQGTQSPVHVGSMPMTCRDCHQTTAWIPALGGGHPEDRFPIASGPHAMECLSCHKLALGASALGQNTDCTGCHGGDHARSRVDPTHAGLSGYVWDDVQPHFCLTCHADGRAPRHPEASFPIASGAHQVPCSSCHDPALGDPKAGQNTTCIGCHDHARAVVDPAHTGVATYAWDDTQPHFCLTCHPNGQGGKHPEAKFPIASGGHRNIPCADCHDRTLGADTGGKNVSCTGCHTGQHAMATMVRRHSGVRNFVWSDTDKAFCRQCHQTGRGG